MKFTPTAGKFLVTLLVNQKGPLLSKSTENGQTINAQRYCDTFALLREVIKNKHWDLMTEGVILLTECKAP